MALSIPTFYISCGSVHIDLISTLIYVGIIFCVYYIVSLTVNLEFGYTGIPNFGKVLFVSVGGLLAGSLSYRLAIYVLNLHSNNIIDSQAKFISDINQYMLSHTYFGVEILLFSLAIGAGLSALFGYLASFPAIRLREDYLGMLLLAAGQFFLIFVTAYYPITGGTEGLLVPDPVYWAVSTNGLRDVVVLGIVAVGAVLVFLYAERVARSPLGRMMRAVRDNEVSSEAIGKDTIGVKRNVLIIASALSGIAGVLYVLVFPAISPTTFTRTVWTFYPFVIVILGGAANNLGVGIGTAVFVGIETTIDQARTCVLGNGLVVPIDINAIEPIAIGVLLLVVLMWRPKGLLKEKPSHTIDKAKLQAIFDKANDALKKQNVTQLPQSTETKDVSVDGEPEDKNENG
jgi:branched-chain amino acid transport system permease protein